jgi:hypothetical protein
LQCLGEFDLEIYQMGFIDILIREVFETKLLECLAPSLKRFWVDTIANYEYRNEILNRIKIFE